MGLNKRLIDQAGGAGGGLGEPTDNFDIVTYTGNGSTQSITSLDFQPDLVWVKSRETTRNHIVSTSVQQQYNYLSTNLTNAEATSSARITSLDSNGFTLGTSTNVNENNTDYVAWCFKSGGSSNTFNVDGTGYSTASAAGLDGGDINPTGASINTASGFSIIRFSTGSSSLNYVEHGLNQEPELVIWKRLGIATGWFVVTNATGSGKFGYLNTTAAFTSAAYSTYVKPTTIFDHRFSGSGEDVIAYCFHSVDGYQKVGSYTGTGYTQNDISLSFAPRFVMVKNTSSSASWNMFDLSRDVANGNGKYLQANSDAVESNIGQGMIFLSNGFRWKDQPDNEFNGSGQTYVYLAIA